MHANIIEQVYYLWTYIGRARLPPLNLYYHLAMKDAIIQALCSKTCKIASTSKVTSSVSVNYKYKF